MFDIALMDSFYSYDSDPDFTIADDVKNAYYIFVCHICTEVASKFKNHVSSFQNRDEQRKYKPNLTKTDEAFAFWLVKLKYEECVKEVEEIRQLGCNVKEWTEKKKKFSKKGKRHGPTDYTLYYGQFIAMCEKIQDLRDNDKHGYMFWMNVFFDKLVEHNEAYDPFSANSLSPIPKGKLSFPVPINFD